MHYRNYCLYIEGNLLECLDGCVVTKGTRNMASPSSSNVTVLYSLLQLSLIDKLVGSIGVSHLRDVMV